MVSEGDPSHRSLVRDRRLLSLTLVSAVGTFGAAAVSPTLPAVAAALDVNEATVGLLMTVYTLPQIALVLVLGMLADTYGRRRVLLPALVVYGLSGVAVVAVDSFLGVVGLRLVQGLVAGAIIPLAITVIGDLYDGAVGATAQGIRLSANGLSSVVVPAFAGLLAGVSWQYPFLLFALALPAAALGYLFVPETAGEADGAAGIGARLVAYGRALRVELADRNLALLVAGGFVQGVALFALLTFVPLFGVNSLGASTFAAGLALSMRGVARIGVAPLTGVVLERTTRRVALGGSLLVAALGTALVPAAPSVRWLGAAVGLFGLGDALFTPVHRDALTGLADAERRAGVVNGMVVLRQAGATLAPVAFGTVLSLAGFRWVFLLAGGVFAAYAAVLLLAFDPDA